MCFELKFCTEMDWQNRVESLRAAYEERPDNINNNFSNPAIGAAIAMSPAPYIALLFQRKWQSGRALRIAFLGDVDPVVRSKIVEFAKQWLNFVNLNFDFVDGTAGDIRISTTPGRSWSYIGTDAKLIPGDQPTMNFGWLLPNSSDEEYSSVVIHEFGHALGAIHEHQRPEAGIPWDHAKVYEYYEQQGWRKDEVDNFIFAKYDTDQLNSSVYDRASIMHYAVPNELTVGDWEVGWNTMLSDTDKEFMRSQYAEK